MMTAASHTRPWYRYWEASTPDTVVPSPHAAPVSVVARPTAADPPATAAVEHAGQVEESSGTVFHVEPPDSAPPPSSDAPHQPADPPAVPVELTTSPTAGPTRYRQATILAIANQKGGVGKTTTSVSLAASLAEHRLRVLLVDFDPQGNASSGLGLRTGPGDLSIYDVLVDGRGIDEAVVPTSQPNLELVRANIDLAGAEVELVSAFSREHKLRKALHAIRDGYDVIIIDCPPSLGLLTVNAMTAADGVVVPIQCEYFALEGLGALRRNAELIREQLNPHLEMTGFVLTMLDARTRLSQQVVDEVRAHFGDRVFDTRIPRSVRLAEAPGFGQPITQFDPASRGAMAYRRLANEVIARLDARAARMGQDVA